MSVRMPNMKPREYVQVVWCPRDNYGVRIVVQSRRGGHTCAQCNGEMEVYEPRRGKHYEARQWQEMVPGKTYPVATQTADPTANATHAYPNTWEQTPEPTVPTAPRALSTADDPVERDYSYLKEWDAPQTPEPPER